MLFQIFDATEAVAFAKKISSEIQQHFPNTQKPATAKSLGKSRNKLDAIIFQTQAFSQQHRLNIYKKAKFLNTIKWTLKESGHEHAFIDEIVRLLANVMNSTSHEKGKTETDRRIDN